MCSILQEMRSGCLFGVAGMVFDVPSYVVAIWPVSAHVLAGIKGLCVQMEKTMKVLSVTGMTLPDRIASQLRSFTVKGHNRWGTLLFDAYHYISHSFQSS